jgi:ABC-type transporter Mla MlaB component
MLMITHSEGSDMTLTLKLEGKLLEPWIGELQTACETFKVPADRVRLDLSTLTFVDSAGARFLDRLIRDGAKVIACSGFVAELLQIARR